MSNLFWKFFALVTVFSIHQSELTARIWTNTEGVEIEAELVQILDDSVILKMGSSEYTVRLENLSEADREFIESQRRDNSEAEATGESPDEASAYLRRVEASLLRNSDFTASSGWKGGVRKKIETEDGTELSVFRVKLSGRDEVIRQEFKRPEGVTGVRFEMRYQIWEGFKTDKEGSGTMTIKLIRPTRDYTYFDRSIESEGKGWVTVGFTFDRLYEADDWVLEIVFRPGDGDLLIRDIFLDPI